MARVGGDDAGFFVNTEALRTDSKYWQEMAGELESAASCPETLIHFGKITDMNPLVDAANKAIHSISARCAFGMIMFAAASQQLQKCAQEYEDNEQEIF